MGKIYSGIILKTLGMCAKNVQKIICTFWPKNEIWAKYLYGECEQNTAVMQRLQLPLSHRENTHNGEFQFSLFLMHLVTGRAWAWPR